MGLKKQSAWSCQAQKAGGRCKFDERHKVYEFKRVPLISPLRSVQARSAATATDDPFELNTAG